mgnify:CR=1 FL=1
MGLLERFEDSLARLVNGAFARAFNLPVCASFRCQDLIDNRDAHYVGDVGIGINPKLAARLRVTEADVALADGVVEVWDRRSGERSELPATEALAWLNRTIVR